MRPVRLSLVALLVLAAGPAAAEEIENPEFTNWSKFKKGTSVTRKSTVTIRGTPTEQTLTETLVEVAADKVAVATEVVVKVQGQVLKPNALRTEIPKTIKLAKGQKKEDVLAGRPEGTVEEGTEKLKVGGVETKARWFRFKTDKSEGTVWIADVPGRLAKMVKVEGGEVPVTSILDVIEITKP